MENKLFNLKEVTELIAQNKLLIIAGADELLSQLPDGNWLGGSNPYLLDTNGAKHSKDLLYVKDFSHLAIDSKMVLYDETNITNICSEAYENGLIATLMPNSTAVTSEFATKAPELENQYINPLFGWISGTDFDKIGLELPTVYLGNKRYTDKAVAMHIKLPENKTGRVEIINVYDIGDDDEITFDTDGFANENCFVNGQERNFFEYMEEKDKWFFPLIADYSGAKINIAVARNEQDKRALFLSPVFKDTIYKIASLSVNDYSEAFFKHLEKENDKNIEYSFSCLYNYFNFGLDGKEFPGFTGVFTFGEIGYQLMNATFVYIVIEDK